MSEPADGPPPRAGAGCVIGGALFAAVFVAVWLAAIMLYGLVVEQWELVRVRREFSYEWAFLWAPLIGLALGFTAAFLATRRYSAARLTLLILAVGLIALFGAILLFGLGALI